MSGAGEYGTRELATPLVSTSQPAGSLQQVVSPTLGQGYGTTTQQSSPPGGLQQVPGLTPTPAQGQSGGMGFEPNMATGGALGGIDQHEPSRRFRGNATSVDHHHGW